MSTIWLNRYDSCYTICKKCPLYYKCKKQIHIALSSTPCITVCKICGNEYFICDMQAYSDRMGYLEGQSLNITTKCAAIVAVQYREVLFQPVSCVDNYTAVFICQKYSISTHRKLLDDLYVCGYGQFKCVDNSCILDIALCDGEPNCVDSSDEIYEECNSISHTFSTYIFSEPFTSNVL